MRVMPQDFAMLGTNETVLDVFGKNMAMMPAVVAS